MSDFIRMVSDFFDMVGKVINHTFESLNALVNALTNIYTGLVESIGFFPSFLGGIMLSCFALILMLRLVGR